jgi:hypothetical protein
MSSYSNSNPATDAVAVTPSDSTELQFRALYVGGTGDLVVTTGAGNDVTFQSVPAGLIIPVQGTKVKAATTATKIVALK